MALIDLDGYVFDGDGLAVAGVEARAFLVNSGGFVSTGNTDTTDSNGYYNITGLNTDTPDTGTYAVRVRDLTTGKTRWVPPTKVQVTELVGPDGEAAVPDGSITTDKIEDDAVTEDKLHPDVVSQLGGGGGGGLGPNTVSSSHIINGTITSSDLGDNSVSTNKIQTGAVTNTKLASNAVTTAKVQDGQITESKLSSAVQSKLNSGGGLGTNSVYSSHIVNGEVKTADLDDFAVTEQKLSSNSVSSAKIQSNAVINSRIANGAVSEAKLDSAVQAKLNAVGGGAANVNEVYTDVTMSGTSISSFGIGTNINSESISLSSSEAGVYLAIVLADIEVTSTSGGPYTAQMDLYVSGVLQGASQGLSVTTLAPFERTTLVGTYVFSLGSGTNLINTYVKAVTGSWKSNGAKIYTIRMD